MRLLTLSLERVHKPDYRLLEVWAESIREKGALELVVVIWKLAVETALVEGIWGGGSSILGRPQFLQLVEPVIQLSGEATIIEGTTTYKSVVSVVAGAGLEWLDLLNNK